MQCKNLKYNGNSAKIIIGESTNELLCLRIDDPLRLDGRWFVLCIFYSLKCPHPLATKDLPEAVDLAWPLQNGTPQTYRCSPLSILQMRITRSSELQGWWAHDMTPSRCRSVETKPLNSPPKADIALVAARPSPASERIDCTPHLDTHRKVPKLWVGRSRSLRRVVQSTEVHVDG